MAAGGNELAQLFRFPEFGPVTAANVLDYFAHSPFYDRDCLNERRRQMVHAEGLTLGEANEATRGLDGINYQLIPSQQEPALFLIRKERCKAGQQPTVEGLYYVVDGTVYAAPDLLTLCQSRLRKVAFYLQDAVAKLAPRAAFSASDGPHWDFAPPHDHGSLLGAAQATTPAAAKRASDEARVNNILLGLHAQYQPEAANAAGGAAGAGSTAGGVSGGAGAAAASNGGAAVAVRRPASADAVPPAKRARPSS